MANAMHRVGVYEKETKMKYEEFVNVVLPEMTGYLKTASYHYADDSGGEWSAGAREMNKFTEKAFEYELTYHQLEEIYNAAGPLMSFSAIVDGVLRYHKRNAK